MKRTTIISPEDAEIPAKNIVRKQRISLMARCHSTRQTPVMINIFTAKTYDLYRHF